MVGVVGGGCGRGCGGWEVGELAERGERSGEGVVVLVDVVEGFGVSDAALRVGLQAGQEFPVLVH